MAIDLKGYRIFIASPGGLEEEREAFRKVINDYNYSDALYRGVTFIPVGWEFTRGGKGRPQELINRHLRECDYLVLILWDRWGNPTVKVSEEGHTSGTEEEYNEALKCIEDPECPMKDIVIFFKAVDARKLSDPGEQLQKVLKFREKIEKEKSILFEAYDVVENFERNLRGYLAEWVRKHEDGDNTDDSRPNPPSTNSSVIGVEQSSSLTQDQQDSELQNSDDLIKTAKEIAFEGRFTEAEILFAKAVSINNDLNALLSYGNFLIQRDRLEQAKKNFERVVTLADKPDALDLKARALSNLGDIDFSQGKAPLAEARYRESLEIFEQIGNLEAIADIYSKLGDLYEAREDRDQAEKLELQSLEIYEQLGKEAGMADVYSKLGDIYLFHKDYTRAEQMHRQSVEIKERLGIKEGLADLYTNLANLYQNLGNLEKAEGMYQQSLQQFEQLGDIQGIADVSNSLGDFYVERKNFEDAEKMYRQSLHVFEELQNEQGVADIYNSLGSLYAESGDVDKAESFYQRGLTIFEQLNNKEGMADVYGKLSTIYEMRKDTEQAEALRLRSLELLEEPPANK
jgi:tetratricopeptide (TPR) repeat protein